jgi:hypothetical protein
VINEVVSPEGIRRACSQRHELFMGLHRAEPDLMERNVRALVKWTAHVALGVARSFPSVPRLVPILCDRVLAAGAVFAQPSLADESADMGQRLENLVAEQSFSKVFDFLMDYALAV